MKHFQKPMGQAQVWPIRHWRKALVRYFPRQARICPTPINTTPLRGPFAPARRENKLLCPLQAASCAFPIKKAASLWKSMHLLQSINMYPFCGIFHALKKQKVRRTRLHTFLWCSLVPNGGKCVTKNTFGGKEAEDWGGSGGGRNMDFPPPPSTCAGIKNDVGADPHSDTGPSALGVYTCKDIQENALCKNAHIFGWGSHS